MDEVFGGMEGRFRFSITDSTMMRIVHTAMNKAHERVKSKEGVIERLNEISKFYELAVMQLEGCMKFVQEEPDIFILDSSHEEEVLAGLAEIRNRLRGRLSESEMAIREKDRELTERLDSELKLRQALELKERELVSLRAKLKLEKTRTEGVEDRDGEFCELMNSVDQQVWNIRQKLEPDQHNMLDESIDNQKIEQMGSDIDMLKETLDLAFGKMRNAIILSEVAPIEQQWRWGVEKDTVFILLKGLMWDFQEKFGANMSRQEKGYPIGFRFGGEFWSRLMSEVAGLRNELESVFGQHERPENPSICVEFDCVEGETLGETTEEDRSHYVAKMIKNHESIIRQKSAEAEELNLLRREIMREKTNSSCKREKEPVSLNKRVQEIIVKLDNLKEWSVNMEDSFDDHRDYGEQTLSRKRFQSSEATKDEELPNKMRRTELELELEELNLKTNIMEETYITLLEGFLKDLNIKLYMYDFESLTWEGLCKDLVAEMRNHWNAQTESNNVESQLREEIYCIVFNEVIKDRISSYDLKLAESNNVRYKIICLEESAFTQKLDNDIQALIFSHTSREWNKRIEDYKTDIHVREEICQIVLDETTKSIADTFSWAFCRFEQVKLADSSVEEDVCMHFIRETVKEWKMELDSYNMQSQLGEEIYQFVIFEAFKDAFVLLEEVDSDKQDKLLGCMFCDDKLGKYKQLTTQESLIHKVESLLNCLEVEENRMLSLHSEIRGNTTNLHLVGLDSESFGKNSESSSVSRKLEKALQQLAKSKETLGEMASRLGLIFGNKESVHHLQDNESSIGKPLEEDLKERLISFENSAVIPILGFFQAMMEDFEGRVREKLEINFLRLEQIHHNLDPLAEIVSSLREKKSLYKKAFIRRCQNLHKAETEVDLLGDQVEVILGLLQKIYKTLNHYSPVLQQYSEVGKVQEQVSELMKLIKKELNRVVRTHKH
ncbi:hypothetical protein PanWU01x14_347230 [Parasponia andersonii]|uniref:WPP domain-associated protein n=1 Tax=Parasponia andersonii TaxID=3476 RepID=A0A2P5AC44_PARAD|nr:hypothetical protein PanWU01x14_347230 [Parasponia andersonii]